MRQLVYVAAPYGGAARWEEVQRNTDRACALGRLAVFCGHAPIVVHPSIEHVFGSDADPKSREVGLGCNRAVAVAVAEVGGSLWVLLCDDGTESPGVAAEVVAFRDACADGCLLAGTVAVVPVTALTWSGWRFVAVERMGLSGAVLWDTLAAVPLVDMCRTCRRPSSWVALPNCGPHSHAVR